MQRAGHQRSVSVSSNSQTTPVAPAATVVTLRLLDEPTLACAEEAGEVGGTIMSHQGQRQQELETAIHQRIMSRLHGRVRNLVVRAHGDLVILEGQCATFYTKQLAQHAAMGALNDEQLENAIVVSVPR